MKGALGGHSYLYGISAIPDPEEDEAVEVEAASGRPSTFAMMGMALSLAGIVLQAIYVFKVMNPPHTTPG